MRDFKIIKVAIGRSYTDAYELLADARNFAVWGGSDAGTAVVHQGGRDWLVQVDGSKVVLRYSEPNRYGILDLQSFTLSGQPGQFRPIRLYPNGGGCELCFVNFRRPEHSAEQFASATEWLQSDLLRLKSFLEEGRALEPTFRSHVEGHWIERPVEEVFRFLFEPLNFPKWASVTGRRFEYRGGRDWLVDMAPGPRIVRFAEPNPHGVLDYAVFEAGDERVFSPMRVLAIDGVTFLTHTFFQRQGFSDERFESTAEWITTDLLTAKSLLET